MTEQFLRIEEIAVLINCSTQTINYWYRWKKLYPKHPLAKLLPDYIQKGNRQTRYWKKSDIWSLAKFRSSIPHGRGGILGDVTQKTARKNKTKGE